MLAPLLAHWRERPQRTWSVIVTLFGDAIAPRGGCASLGTLLEVCAGLGIDSGAVRTALSRLVADGWTERSRVGRNSYYRLSARGGTTFAAASERIYAPGPPPWDGRLHLLVSPTDRTAAEAAGYGQPLPGLFVSPHGSADATVALWAQASAEANRAMARMAWPLDRIAGSFERFTQAFAGVADWADPAPLDALLARTLLIHDYRRIVLHGPALPSALLPPDWPGDAARRLCVHIYRRLLPASETWLDGNAMAEGGRLPPAGPALRGRFQDV